MNDELSGMLTHHVYQLPVYANGCIWVDSGSEVAQAEGERGLFALTAPSQHLTVRWGHATGPAIAQLSWQVDCLNWDGTVRIGGMVEALHLAELAGGKVHVVVIYLTGRPLLPTISAYPTPKERQTSLYLPLDFLGSLPESLEDTTTTWLVEDDSPLLAMVQDAISREARIWFMGRLAEEGSGWETLFALPLILEAVTVFVE